METPHIAITNPPFSDRSARHAPGALDAPRREGEVPIPIFLGYFSGDIPRKFDKLV